MSSNHGPITAWDVSAGQAITGRFSLPSNHEPLTAITDSSVSAGQAITAAVTAITGQAITLSSSSLRGGEQLPDLPRSLTCGTPPKAFSTPSSVATLIATDEASSAGESA